MNTTKSVMLMLALALTGLAYAPTVSADHGWHSCHDEGEDCDDRYNEGCEEVIAVNCYYSEDINCKDNDNQPGDDACYHKEHKCLLTLLDRCYVHPLTNLEINDDALGFLDPGLIG